MEKKRIKKLQTTILNANYMVLFDSDSDKGEEILVSLLAKKVSLETMKELYKETANDFFLELATEIEKI